MVGCVLRMVHNGWRQSNWTSIGLDELAQCLFVSGWHRSPPRVRHREEVGATTVRKSVVPLSSCVTVGPRVSSSRVLVHPVQLLAHDHIASQCVSKVRQWPSDTSDGG